MNQWRITFKSEKNKRGDTHILVVFVVKKNRNFSYLLCFIIQESWETQSEQQQERVRSAKGYICAMTVGNVTDLGQRQIHNPTV